MESVKELELSLLQKLRENPVDCNVLNKLGYIYLHSNNLLKSEEYYLRSVAIEPEQFEPYVSLGLINTITLRLGKALYFLLKAKLISPDSPDLLKSIDEINSAIVNKDSKLTDEELNDLILEAEKKLEEDNFSEAVEIYLRLINLSPDNEIIKINLGMALLKNKEYRLAAAFFEEMTGKYPSNAMVYYYAGLAANNLNMVEKAFFCSLKALELKPSLADIMFNGKFAHYKKNYEEEEVTNCPLCEQKNFETVNVINQSVYSVNFNIINPLRKWDMCTDCGLIFANPRPTEKALQEYSFELAFQAGKSTEKEVDKILIETNACNERLNIIETLTSSGKLLDINSGNGSFVTTAKNRNWLVTGIEKNTLKFNLLEEISGVESENKALADFNSEDGFEVITLWDSIEKKRDFTGSINKIHSLLKPGGLFAFSFHGSDTFVSEQLEFSYPLWYYPDYLYFFNIVLLKKQMEKLGFTVEKIQVTGRKYLANVEFYCRKV